MRESPSRVVWVAALVLLLGSLLLVAVQGARQLQPASSPVGVRAAQMPATVSVLSGQHITVTGQSSGYGTAYYREGMGYISTTWVAGTITYTWQTSPDKTTWFTHSPVPAVGASGLVTVPMGYLGPYARLYYEADASADVTVTVWLGMKE